MVKMRLNDGYEIEIHDATNIQPISADIANFDKLKELCEKLTPGNLTKVQLIQDEEAIVEE